MEYNYIISNNHHLIELGDKTFLIDTGSPDSFSFNQPLTTKINDKEIKLKINSFLSIKEIENLVGHHLDGFIGLDLLKEFATVSFNKDTMKVSFSKEVIRNNDSVDFDCPGFIKLNAVINDKEFITLLDTGARINYVDGNVKSKQLITDYNPIIGKIVVPYGDAKTLIGNKEFTLGYGDLCKNALLKQTAINYRFEAILGINGLFDHCLEINLQDKFINFA